MSSKEEAEIVLNILQVKQEEDPRQFGAICLDVTGTATVVLVLVCSAFGNLTIFHLQSLIAASRRMVIQKVGSGED